MKMATKMTARIPTTPETHQQLRNMVKSREEINTYDELLQSELLTTE
jgi:hypothetical protein